MKFPSFSFFKQQNSFFVKKDELSFVQQEKHWRLIIIYMFVGGISVGIFSAYLFWEINNDGIFQADTSTTSYTEPINRDKLNNVLDYFDQKNKKSAAILANPPKVVDPSR
ncbi:MAG: hypothetical protein WC795_02900 [Candidatus Paceibacterota bacterium]|jgi:hypothetical protein